MLLKTAAMQLSLSHVGPQRAHIALIATFPRRFHHLLVHRDHETGEGDYVEHIVVEDPIEAGEVTTFEELEVHARNFG